MIIDVRYNGGGFVDQLIFRAAAAVLSAMSSARNWEIGTQQILRWSQRLYGRHPQSIRKRGRGIFSEFFKVYKLGPLSASGTGPAWWGMMRSGSRACGPLRLDRSGSWRVARIRSERPSPTRRGARQRMRQLERAIQEDE